ncbi:MAG: hypothetical protein IPF93_11305 [Saprospiraceae bacterium]|nr:hypothetical protein [Saprospiraceae bacterium]
MKKIFTLVLMLAQLLCMAKVNHTIMRYHPIRLLIPQQMLQPGWLMGWAFATIGPPGLTETDLSYKPSQEPAPPWRL